MEPKSAGSIFSGRINDAIGLCDKLSELEKAWVKVTGEAVGSNSSLAGCEFAEDGLRIKINVANASLVRAVKFRKNSLKKSIEKFLGSHVADIEIAVGKVTRLSSAKPPLPAYKRRAPLIISEEAVEKQTKVIENETGDTELSQHIARIKVITEKWHSRDKH
jgi:hypothetical protein